MNVIFLMIFIFLVALFVLPFLIILAFGSYCYSYTCYTYMYRAAIEEQYAKALMKLSKSTLADNEEG